MLERDWYASLGLEQILAKVEAGERLSIEDGEQLFACPDISAVGALAHFDRVRRHGTSTHYVINRHVNYTNVCVNNCLFCAFRRERGETGSFELSHDTVLDKIADSRGACEVHIVGGCHPDLRLSFFTGLIERIKAEHPAITVKAFTAVEIAHFAELESLTTLEVLAILQQAGLDMLPGGGAEIFAPEIRQKICPRKTDGENWLRIAGEAHGLGIPTNATMLFGHLESIADRLDHLDQLRRQQDSSGGFVCFIPLPFLTEASLLELPEERKGPHTGLDELRTIAVSRLMLDNIQHIKAYWVMLSVKQAQTALWFGADDLDGTVVEEKIGHMAGAQSEQALSRAELEAMIQGCGLTPVQRDSLFRPLAREEATT